MIIDRDEAKVEALCNQYDIMGTAGNGASFSVQMEADISNADLMIAVTGSDELNLLCCTVAKRVGEIMGENAEAAERRVAFVRCKGSCEVTHNQGNYIGIDDCRAAALSGLNVTDCDYGCMGFGSCVKACPQDAISVINGVAVVNRVRCVGCGLCAKACPKNLIELVPESKRVIVQCSNRDKGPMVKKVCSAGCIGCGICAKQCAFDAIHVDGNLASVTYENCVQCGRCVDKCPAKVITKPENVSD